MAYVQNFLHDVFISYAHNDNLPDANGKCWVAEFKSQLENAIKQRLEGNSDKLDIFFDDSHLHANSQLDKLLSAASHSALFLAIASPSYASRDWTKKELQAFIDTKPDLDRLFAVERLPVTDSGIYPAPLTSHKRMAFFANAASGTALPFKPNSDLFEEEIHKLADQICRQLQHLTNKTVEPTITEATGVSYVPGYSHDVVISHAVEDEAWATQLSADVKKQLQFRLKTHDGFQIATATDDSLTASTATLLSVTSPAYYQQHKAESAALNQLAKQNALFLVEYEPCKHSGCLNGPTRHKFWLDDDNLGIIPITDDDYHFKLEKLVVVVADKLKQTKAEQEHQQRLEQQIAQQQQNRPTIPAFSCFLYVHGDAKDLPLAEAITQLLHEHGIDYALPIPRSNGLSAADISNDFENNIINCDAILILYDQTTLAWIRGQLVQCQRVQRKREQPLAIIAIHKSQNQPDIGMNLSNLQVYPCPPEDIQTYLPKFIAELKQAVSLEAL